MKTAYSFVRWSSSRQSNLSSDSKRRQIKSAEDWCQANGYQLSKQVFIGAAESGFKSEHLKVKDGVAIGALARFIEAVEKKQVNGGSCLCVDSVDRFSRQEILDALEPFTKILNLGIGIVFTGSPLKELITRELINKHPEKLQWLINDMIRSWAESAEKSRKVKEAKASKKAKMQAGEIVSHNNIPKYFSFDKESKRYVHNEHTKIISKLIEGSLSGKSLYEMARDLNRRGVPTIRRKFEWSGNSIGVILRNPALIGTYLGNKNYLPPIIDEATFYKLQGILNKNVSHGGGKKAALFNIFKGIAYCSSCNSKMNVGSGVYKGVPYRYIHCGSYGKQKSCKDKSFLPLNLIELDFFLNFLGKNPAKLLKGSDSEQEAALQTQINIKTLALNQKTSEIKKLLVISGRLNIDELESTLVKLTGERDELKAQLDDLTYSLGNVQDAPKNLREINDWFAKMDAKHAAKKDWAWKIIDLDSGETKEVKIMSKENFDRFLKDNEWREKFRVMLPRLVEKLVFDSQSRSYVIKDRTGREIYKSATFPSNNNNSDRWRESLKTWTNRKTAGGKVIVCKRYAVKRKPKGLKAL